MHEKIKAGLQPMTLVRPEEAKRQRIINLEEKLDRLRKERKVLLGLLRKYSQHNNHCAVRRGFDRCDCGFKEEVLPHLEQ